MIPKVLKTHPFTEERLYQEKKWILEEFKAFGVSEQNFSPSLFDYLSKSPERFFCRKTFQDTNLFLDETYSKQKNLIETSFVDNSDEISVGLSTLTEVNRMKFHECEIKHGDIESYYFIDTELHPALLKLIEGAFANLIFPISVYLRLKRNKSLDKLDVFNRVEELKNANLNSLIAQYSNTVRNSIAHGKVKFGANDISYVDKKRTIIFSNFEVIKMFDRFVDICNAISLSLILFLHKVSPNPEGGIKKSILALAERDFIHVLNSPGWSVDKVLESETISNTRQLNVFAKNTSKDFNKVSFHSFRSGVLAEKFLPGFDRYFISIRSKNHKAGWDSLDGHKLKTCRLSESDDLDLYGEARDKGGFFFWQIKIPKIFFRIETLFYALKVGVDRFWNEWHKSFPKRHKLRTSKIHRVSFFLVIQGSALLTETNETGEKEIVKTHLKNICKKIKSKVKSDQRRTSILRYLPIGYFRINLYKGDYRERELGVNGLPSELICTVTKRYYGRIKDPDIIGGTVEEIFGYRVVWNRAYLESYQAGQKRCGGTLPRLLY